MGDEAGDGNGRARLIAVGGLLVVALALVVVLLLTGGTSYRVKAVFLNASQIVKGDRVQVAGLPIGSVTDIGLTHAGQAELTLEITSGSYAPLRRGTRFIVRAASLSGIANRYVDLQLPPGDAHLTGTYSDGAVIPSTETTSTVDLDQLFDTLDPRTRRGLQRVVQGSASQYRGKAALAQLGWSYLDPAVASSTQLFAELSRDTHGLRRFVTASAGLVRDLAARRNHLTGLVAHTAAATGAIARPPEALAAAVRLLPPVMRRANTTFVELRSTLDTLSPVVEAAKPVARKLQPFLATLRPLARDAVPTVRDLSAEVSRPGRANDLTELARDALPLEAATVRTVQANGRQREGAFPASTRALASLTPELAYLRPWAVDLTGWFDDFSHSGLYDALGSASRASPIVNTVPVADRLSNLLSNAETRQFDRCPGSAERPLDGSNPYRPTPDYPCDPTQLPPGP